VELEPYGWNSPRQIAARLAQNLELRVERHTGIKVPPLLVHNVRDTIHGALHGWMLLTNLDRRAADAITEITRR
jgi:hypothetical protein